MPSPSRRTGAPAAAANMAIAHWASSVPAARPQFAHAPPDAEALQKLSEALSALRRAQVYINVGRSELRSSRGRVDAFDNNHRGARHFLGQMARYVCEAQARLAAVQPDPYAVRQLQRVLRDARGSVRSTFRDFHHAGRNYPYAKWRLEKVMARMRRECV